MGKKQFQNISKNRVRIQAQFITKQCLKHLVIDKIRNKKVFMERQTKARRNSRVQRNQTTIVKSFQIFQNAQLNQIVDEKTFECPICLEIMIKPTLLECGHAYCAKCLQELMIYKSSCGVCRHVQVDPQFKNSQILENLIENFITKKSQNSFDYYVRLTDTQNWRRLKSIQKSQLCKGQFIDFRDKQLRWRKGEITKMIYQEKINSYIIELTYKKGEDILVEELSSNSNRIAKLSYYTKMKYLETAKNQSNIIEQNQVSEIFRLPLTQSFVNTNDQMDMFFFEGSNRNNQIAFQTYEDLNQIFTSSLPRLLHRQSLTDIFQSNRGDQEAHFQILS